jgi:3-oxoadipate enol-lactonase
MPHIDVNGAVLHYHLQGPEDAPAIVFSNSLGATTAMWQPQLHALCENFRVLRADTRGHGHSAATPGPYTTELLAKDVLALTEALRIERFHFCGISMGGQTGQWLLHNAPERLKSATISNTAMKIGNDEAWNARIAKVTSSGLECIATSVIEKWFTPAFFASSPDVVTKMRERFVSNNALGYAACCAAVRDADFTHASGAVRNATKEPPVLVIGGAQDKSVPAADSKALAEKLPGAKYLELNAAHISNMEAHTEFTDALIAHVNEAEAQHG